MEHQAVDLPELEHRLLGDRDLLRTVCTMFVDDARSKLVDLAAMINAGDALAAGRLAHGLKGAAANLGAHYLRELAEIMEHAGHDGKLEQLSNGMEELRVEVEAVITAIGPYIDDGAGS